MGIGCFKNPIIGSDILPYKVAEWNKYYDLKTAILLLWIYAFIGFTLVIYRYGMDTALMKFSIQVANTEKKSYISSIYLLQLVTSLIFSIIFLLGFVYDKINLRANFNFLVLTLVILCLLVLDHNTQ